MKFQGRTFRTSIRLGQNQIVFWLVTSSCLQPEKHTEIAKVWYEAGVQTLARQLRRIGVIRTLDRIRLRAEL